MNDKRKRVNHLNHLISWDLASLKQIKERDALVREIKRNPLPPVFETIQTATCKE